jgi:hypothetical protein
VGQGVGRDHLARVPLGCLLDLTLGLERRKVPALPDVVDQADDGGA